MNSHQSTSFGQIIKLSFYSRNFAFADPKFAKFLNFQNATSETQSKVTPLLANRSIFVSIKCDLEYLAAPASRSRKLIFAISFQIRPKSQHRVHSTLVIKFNARTDDFVLCYNAERKRIREKGNFWVLFSF